MHFVFFGLSLTSSWGNGHATTYRGLLGGLRQLGHQLDFFERDVPWYASHRDLPNPTQARLHLYSEWAAVRTSALDLARSADVVIVGSYFPDAIHVLDALFDALPGAHSPLLCFYDIDTPITLERLRSGACAYLRADHIPALDLYLSFTGGPILTELSSIWGARHALPLYCACDVEAYRQARRPPVPPVALSFLGTFSPDRETKLRRLLLEPARQLPQMQFQVAGSMYPSYPPVPWPANIQSFAHLPPARHPAFYANSRFTLNLTRQAMVEAGYSPSIRLFEAAAAATPILTDPWPGIETFFTPGRDILVASDTLSVVQTLLSTSAADAAALGRSAQIRILESHTGLHRARELMNHLAVLHSTEAAVAI